MGQTETTVLKLVRQETLDATPFLEELRAYPSGHNIKNCIQCGVCTASCPLSSEMTETPRKIIEMIKAGMRDQVLSSDTMWFCASCYYCTVRCPQGINLAEVMYGLRTIATKTARNLSAAFYQTFADTVRRYGRMHESDLMVRFALRTSPLSLLKMGPLGLRMLAKGKMSLGLPSAIRGAKEIAKLYDKVAEMEGGV
ncbi:MAG: 4Fe-4S dicluster domain-containing protein [Bacillota bacterium]|jgi:heterodisulfide reductase subunit C|nr:MAG: 4Fe-4S dicluster domain-containing protein [Bacillota bacterium]